MRTRAFTSVIPPPYLKRPVSKSGIGTVREGLELLRSHLLAGEARKKQIRLFTLIEDECRRDRPEARPV